MSMCHIDAELSYVCVPHSSLTIPLHVLRVHEQPAKIECAHFANSPQFQFPVTEAHVHCYVRRSVPKSQLYFQEPPLEWQKENPLCFPLYGCDSSRYIDIYIVFLLGCSPRPQGGLNPEMVAGRSMTVEGWSLMCEAMASETLSTL